MKFLHVSDFHFDAKKELECCKNGEAVVNAAQENNVDFIIDSGDWWHRPHYASEKDGIKTAVYIMDMWSKAAPVCGIYGTNSHQAPGSMSIFPGFTVLEPGKIYGLKDKTIKEIDSFIPEAVLFGIPEVNKKNIMASLNLTAEQANAKAEDLYVDYVNSFIAPMRLKYKDLPAVCAVHGNFSDSGKELSTDEIMKASDIVVHTELLRGANIDYWAAGHIHKPSIFKNITGAYAGSWGRDWNETGFLPGFNLVEINDGKTTITRIPYGTMQREKVKDSFVDFKDDVLYKIVTDNPDYVAPGHVNHVIDYKPKPSTTKRITAEEAEECKTLWHWFKMADPNVDERLMEKVDLIESKLLTTLL